MPVFTVDAAAGTPPADRRRTLEKIREALSETYRLPDIRGWLREYPRNIGRRDGSRSHGLEVVAEVDQINRRSHRRRSPSLGGPWSDPGGPWALPDR